MTSLVLRATPAVAVDARQTAVVFAAATVWLALFAGLRPLNLPDEGRYIGVAWEMLAGGGDWLTPTLDGLPFFHKPPLFYWLSAAVMRVVGPSEWTARLPLAIVGGATVALLYSALVEWHGTAVARRAAFVLATTPLFFAGAQFGNMDLLVAATIAGTILLAARALLRQESGGPWRLLLLAAFCTAGLGVLAKGLIGAVLPGLVVLAWVALRRKWRSLGTLFWLPGLALFALVVVPWPALEERRFPDFLHYFIVVQHFQRYTTTGFNNAAPFWFYVPVLAALCLPWSGWLAGLLPAELRRRARPDAVASLMLVWIVVIIAFFSIPQSKLLGYIIPCTVPLAALVAILAARTPARGRWSRAAAAWTTPLAAVLCVALVVTVTLTRPVSSRPLADTVLKDGRAEDGVAFVDGYWYDFPFYLRRRSPVIVVTDWNDPGIARGDDWRKELADAGKFAPETASGRLESEAGLRDALCRGQVRWVLIHEADIARHPYLHRVPVVASERTSRLLKVEPTDEGFLAALGCRTQASER